MSVVRTNPIAGVTQLSIIDWDTAIDCVDYPVKHLPLSYLDVDVDPDTYVECTGVTITGRENKFFGCVVERDRDGKKHTISTVNGTYGHVPVASVYRNLKASLEDGGHQNKPRSVYVSGNGGTQELTVALLDKKMMCGSTPLEMVIRLKTSVNGSKSHGIELSVWDKDNEREVFGFTDGEVSLSARHTKAVLEKHIAFEAIIMTLVNRWDDSIAPMIEFMGSENMSGAYAIAFVEALLDDANIPQKHIDAITEHVGASTLNTQFDVISIMSEYLNDALGNKPERLAAFRKSIGRSLTSTLKNKIKKS